MSKKQQFSIGEVFDPSFKDLSAEERKQNLEGMSAKIEEGEYTKKLSKEELDVAKSELADVSIEIAKIEDEKKEMVDKFKEILKPKGKKYSELLEAIKFKSIRKKGTLYLVDDQEEGVMYYFDENAICVDSRALLPQERQTHLGSGVRKISGK